MHAMQAATPPMRVAPSGSSSSSSSAHASLAANALPLPTGESSRRPTSAHTAVNGDPLPDQAAQFLANHHRMHNQSDPKLRANPSFKSRRSSLFGSVLKSRSRHDDAHKPTKTPSRVPATSGSAKPRASAVASHHHRASESTISPTSNHRASADQLTSFVSDPPRPAHTGHQAASERQSEPTHATVHQAKASLFHSSGSPPTTSLSSPVEAPEGSASSCSSANVKGFNFAAISDPQVSTSVDSVVAPTSTPLLTRGEGRSSSNATVLANPILTEQPLAYDSNASHAAQMPPDMRDRSPSGTTSPASIPAASATTFHVLTTSLDPLPRSEHASQSPTPIITRSIAPDLDATTDATQPAQAAERNGDDDFAANVTDTPERNPQGPRDSPTGQGLPRSNSVTSPQRFSSLSRKSAARLTLDRDTQGSLAGSHAAARDITEELESPAIDNSRSVRANRRMSMLDFLAVDSIAGLSPQLAQASLSAEHLPRDVQQGSSRASGSSTSVPASMPLLQASRQLRLETSASRIKAPQPRRVDLCDNVRILIEPLIDRLNMFGSMQSGSNYSLAGTVVVEVPKLNVPRLSAAAAVGRDGLSTAHPSVHVSELKVRFIGYSAYVDATGRFNAVKLVDNVQNLLQPQGFSCPVELVETGEQSTFSENAAADARLNDADQQTLKYETEFDLSIPGWLPASQRSRFGATFYCVQAMANVGGQAILSALSGYDGLGTDSWQDPASAPSAAKSLESELHDSSAGASPVDRKEGSPISPASVRAKSKNSWLNKTAKQLQLRTLKKSTVAELTNGNPSPITRRDTGIRDVARQAFAEPDALFTKTTEAHNQRLPDGEHSIKSECISILVRRCRDVVPVPVARLARLATASQVMRGDGTTPSLSQSMVALARLQEGLRANTATSETADAAAGRFHLPASASAPMLMNAHAQQRISEAVEAVVSPVGTTTPSLNTDVAAASSNDANADVQDRPTLAPSPRIDSNPREWGASPATLAAEEAQSNLSAEPETRTVMPRAPSAFDLPRDPAKLAAAASSLTPSATLPNLPSSMSRGSLLLDPRLGNAQSPPRTSSRSASASRSSAPLRHFVHRPVLQPPPGLGVTPDKNASGGLNFSLTLSLPSHVHVSGPKSDVLSFGVQIEVGRTEGWDALRQWGGLRLKDMELVCMQTEKHSSMPSRSFLHTFPVPPLQQNVVYAADLPVITTPAKTLPAAVDAQSAAEARLRQSYDRTLVLDHINLVNKGQAPDPVEHNVERVRTTIVGPPPFAQRKRGQEAGREDGDATQKGKAKVDLSSNLPQRPAGLSRSPSRGGPAGSGANTPDASSQSNGLGGLRTDVASGALSGSGSLTSTLQPVPRGMGRADTSSNSTLRQTFQGSDGLIAMQSRSNTGGATMPAPPPPNGSSRSRRPIPFDLSGDAVTTTPTNERNNLHRGAEVDTFGEAGLGSMPLSSSQRRSRGAPSTTRTDSGDDAGSSVYGTETQRRIDAASGSSTRMGLTSTVSTRSAAPSAPRRSRFENAISRLSTFASSMLEQPNEPPIAGPSSEVQTKAEASAHTRKLAAQAAAAASLRATYAFAGDDGQGVDLTKGRVRMTINLPLVSNNLDVARKAGSAQLIPDFESPYVRIRHKLKVKLGFGLKSGVAAGQDGDDWAQALVMCVPVRFTEAPPKEVQEQFGPVSVAANRSRSAASGAGQPADPSGRDTETVSEVSETQQSPSSALPLLPAYAQLFREDGSRLADEGEDLPRYPGRMSVVGEIDEDLAAYTSALEAGHGDEASTSVSATNALSTVDEDRAAAMADIPAARSPNVTSEMAAVLPRFSSLSGISGLASMPTPMDRTTSLPGRRILTRTTSSGIYGLRTLPSHSTLPRSSLAPVTTSTAETNFYLSALARVGSSAFDPLPTRPGMRRRSATTASLVTFSRITPAEVLDEALVTNAMDEEEDRMDGLQPSHTLDSINGRPHNGEDDGMGGSGQEEDEEDDDVVGDMGEDMDEEEVDMELNDGRADSPGDYTLRMHDQSHRQLDEDEEDGDITVGQAV